MPNINKQAPPIPSSPPNISPHLPSRNTSQPNITPKPESSVSAQHTLDVTEQKQSKATTSISLDLDDSKPGAPNKTQTECLLPNTPEKILKRHNTTI